MTRIATKAPGMAIAAWLAAGCTLFDTGTEVRLDPQGRVYTQGSVAIRIHASDRTQARLVLDGRLLDGDYPVGVDVTIDLETEADGVHRLVARVYDGERQRDSSALEVMIDRVPPTFAVTPTPGQYASPNPFVVVVHFSEAVDPASVGPSTVRLVSDQAPGSVVPTEISLAGDGRGITITASARLDQIGPVHLEMSARDLAGNLTSTGLWPPGWQVPRLDLYFAAGLAVPCGQTLGVALRGHLDIVAYSFGRQDMLATVLVDGVAIGTLSPANPRLTWDSSLFADGPRLIGFESLGYVGFDWRTFLIDNTPPSVASCAPRLHAPDDASVWAGVDVVFSEPICEGLLPGGGCPPTCLSSMTDRLVVGPGVQEPPFSWTFTFPGVVDGAGQAVAPLPACTVDFPAWTRAWGSGPLDDGSGAPFGSAAFRSLTVGADAAELVRVATVGAPTPGAVQVMRSAAPAPWAADPASLNGTPFAPASQLHSGDGGALAWLETDQTGAQRVRAILRGQGIAQTVTTVDAPSGPVEIGVPSVGAVTWTQASGTGAREARLARWSQAAGWAMAPPANADTASDASQPSAAEGTRLRMAFAEAPPGGVPQLRVRELQDDGLTWIDLGDALNRDPAVAAEEPWLGADGDWSATVAWVEGGQALARRGDWLGNWGPPVVLNADAAAPARAPRVTRYGSVVVFVEQAVDGDRFEVRKWDEQAGSWKALPSLQAGAPVASYASYEIPLAIVWTNATGETWLRISNSR